MRKESRELASRGKREIHGSLTFECMIVTHILFLSCLVGGHRSYTPVVTVPLPKMVQLYLR